MEIKYSSPSCNKSGLVVANGQIAPAVISQAYLFSSIDEDINFSTNGYNSLPFLIVPLSEGTIHVRLVSGVDYTIQESEVSASMGAPLLYLVEKIYKEGTTVTSLTCGL